MTKTEVLTYLEEHPMDIQNAHVCFLGLSWAYEAYTLSHQITGINISPLFGYFDDKGYTQISDDGKLIEIGDWLYLGYQKNPQIIKQLLADQSGYFEQVEKTFTKLNKTASDATVVQIYDNIVKYSIEWWKYPVIGETKGTMIEKHIVPRFAESHHLVHSEALDYLYTLAASDELTNFTREIKLRHELALKALKDPTLSAKLTSKDQSIATESNFLRLFDRYALEFFWINTDFYEAKELTPLDFAAKLFDLNHLSIEELESEISKINNEQQKNIERQQRLRKQLKLTQQDIGDINFIREFIVLMEQRKVQMMKQCYYSYSLCREMSQRMRVPYDDIAFISYQELRELFVNHRDLNMDQVRAMKAGAFAVYADGHIDNIFLGNDAQEMLLAAKHNPDEVEVKGMVASRDNGENVTGMVRIVNRPEEPFLKNDVLVTSMTRVELVPIMKLASAIITDEGGMACHAAIVSRELGIPCIVGTKKATLVFKDGDNVIINLKTGIIGRKEQDD